ncbi:MAG: LamG domain-containing protein [Phycisphaerae bacterium]|nr:LamG domain-containing protein [Phycisphaerae bacterium]
MIFSSIWNLNPTFQTIKISSLTEGRVLFAGADGQLSDSENLTFVSDMLGIGTSSPQRPLHIRKDINQIYTLVALDNENTVDNSSGICFSFRGLTTGTGATAFKELGAIDCIYTTHNHATFATTIRFYPATAGSLVEAMKLSGALATFTVPITGTDLTLSGLTASQAVMTNADKKLVSADYLNQAVKTTSSPTFADITAKNFLPANLKAHYHFNSGVGKDLGPNANDLTLNGGADAANGVLVLDGTGDYAVSGSNIGISGATARTIICWAKRAQGTGSAIIWDWGNMVDNYKRFALVWNGSTAAAPNTLQLAISGGNRIWTWGQSLNTWYHIAVVLPDGEDNTNDLIAYVNGVALSVASTVAQTINTVDGPLYIGIENDGTDNDFAGQIDDVMVFDRGLSQQEILRLFKDNSKRYITADTVAANIITPPYGSTLAANCDLAVSGKFSCNGASPQATYTSGGAVATTAGAFGFGSDAERIALTTLVNNLRSALIGNGIMI